MNLAASCAEIAEDDLLRLLDRLCDIQADVVYFPVRHHSPASAHLVRQLIDHISPAAVLIEGPSDFNEHFDELLLEHQLPIAIYSYFRRSGVHSGAYYPFSEYSPEWNALRHARQRGVPVQFIDLPWSVVSEADQLTHRYADGELRRGRYVEHLCRRMHVENFDDLWDQLIECHESLSLEDYLQRTHSLCFHIRLWETSISPSDRRREAFMVEQIREKRNEVSGPILVVTGGFHSSALAALTEDYLCPGIEPIEAAPEAPPPAPLDDVGIALTTYSYERLDNLKGYNSGLPNPGFYENAWRQRQAGQGFCHTALLRELVRELRNRKQTLSTADLIAVETSARGLASLRGRGHVWRSDLVDAVTSALIKDELEFGCQSPFLDAVHAVLRGNRRGRLAEGTRMPPLVVDIRQLLESFGMEPSPATREVTLDLLSPDDVSRSRLLHRLKLIGVIGYERVAGTDFLHRDDLKQLWEKWSIRWSPEFEGSCVEASRYGTSLTEAASARLSEMADQMQCDAAVAAALLVQAAQAGVETISASLLEQLETLIEAESGFAEASKALEHLLFLYCYDEAFGTSRLSEVGRLLVTTFSRTLWVLESLGQSAGDERQALRGMKALLETWQRTGGVLRLDAGEFAAVLQRVESDPRKPPSLRGAAAGILWTLGMANDEQILADLLMFAAPANLGDFLAGLFTVAREVAQRHQKLVQTIDRLLMEFGADDFQASLPSMRLAFTYYTPREKHHMLTTLFEALGLKEARPLAPLVVDHLTAAEALRLEERMFELISRYGLEAPHE